MKKIKKNKIILIMGLPGSGKTTLAKKLKKDLNASWINADVVRKKYKDWDFSSEGRERQAKRMYFLAKKLQKKNNVIADFICPTKNSFYFFKADKIIWMDTIKKSRFLNINKIFTKPKKYDLRVTSKDSDIWKIVAKDLVVKYKWDNKKPTILMLGRFQPWHFGHRKLFEKILKKTGQVIIQIKDVKGIGDNPFSFEQIKFKIKEDLKNFKNRFKIIKSPNIIEINYGRKVGYKIKKINLTDELHKISATKIRKKLRRDGLLK